MLAVVMKRHIPFFVALCMLHLTTGAVVLRLVPGPNKGVLQILHNNTWGTLCTNYYFDYREVNVVCRHLGFNTTFNTQRDFGSLPGSVKYWAQFNCNGKENSFNNCPNFNLTRCSSPSTLGMACLSGTESLITLGNEKIRDIEEGGSLSCSVYTRQSPYAYVWTKNGNIQFNQASRAITLKRTDSGNLTCKVYSRTGTKLLGSDSVIVTVLYHPHSLTTRTMYAQRGDTVNLSRSDISLPPPHVYRWRQTGLDSEFTESTKPPVIQKIQLNHKGDYILDVTNRFPSGSSDAGIDLIKLYVSYAPSVKCDREVSVVVGQSLNLECDVDAYPDPHTLTWSHITAYQKEVASMTEKFRVPEASHADGGLYKCEARNNITNRRGDVEVGVGACTIRVTVHYSSEASTLLVVAAKSNDKGGNSMTTVVYVVGSILVLIALCLVIVLVVLTLKRLPIKGNGTEEEKKTETCPDPPEEEHAYEGLSIR
ncbi:hemicentin-2-like [Haliotis rufescens]|uniref:hemicentin-2-like n=1 Tax=Haliotis rufescens TaxID=6454 RepID=UPI00201F2BD7|nr:hemicentin-2-like [Haliotis rufescens]